MLGTRQKKSARELGVATDICNDFIAMIQELFVEDSFTSDKIEQNQRCVER